MSKYLFFIITLVFLTGCSGKEPDNREFVMVMAVGDDVYLYTADTTDANDGKDIIYKEKNDSLIEAVEIINNRSSGELFMGQLQCVIVDSDHSEEIAELLKENVTINRNIPIVYCSDFDKLEDNSEQKIQLRNYISNYFDNYDYKKVSVSQYIADPKIKLSELKIVNEDTYYIE